MGELSFISDIQSNSVTLGSRYPNCSDTETPPLVIRYPNKFYPNYLILGVSISELVRIPRPLGGLGIRTQRNSDSLSEQILSELLDPWGVGIRTGVNKLSKTDINTCTGFLRSEYGELQNLCRTSLARIEAEIKPFYCF